MAAVANKGAIRFDCNTSLLRELHRRSLDAID